MERKNHLRNTSKTLQVPFRPLLFSILKGEPLKIRDPEIKGRGGLELISVRRGVGGGGWVYY